MQQTREQWNAELRAYYFAFPMRAEDGERVLHECVWLIAEDGNTLRYLTCEKTADGTRRAFRERVQQAVKPFLFVKIEEGAAYFSHWNPVPDSHEKDRHTGAPVFKSVLYYHIPSQMLLPRGW